MYVDLTLLVNTRQAIDADALAGLVMPGKGTVDCLLTNRLFRMLHIMEHDRTRVATMPQLNTLEVLRHGDAPNAINTVGLPILVGPTRTFFRNRPTSWYLSSWGRHSRTTLGSDGLTSLTEEEHSAFS